MSSHDPVQSRMWKQQLWDDRRKRDEPVVGPATAKGQRPTARTGPTSPRPGDRMDERRLRGRMTQRDR